MKAKNESSMLDKVRIGLYFNLASYVLYATVFSLLAVLTHQLVVADEEPSCTDDSTFREQVRKSFKVFNLGRTRSIRTCINLCCGKNVCDLALFREGRCFGISCERHDQCRSVLNGLRRTRHEINKRSTTDTEDFSSEFSHSSRSHGFCRQRRVIPHHIYLQGGRGVSNFRRLSHYSMSTKRCNELCCEEKDCSLAFTMQSKCYGVVCPDGGDCNSKEHRRVPLHLEIALVQRKVRFGETNSDNVSATKKVRTHHRKHKHESNDKVDERHRHERTRKHGRKNARRQSHKRLLYHHKRHHRTSRHHHKRRHNKSRNLRKQHHNARRRRLRKAKHNHNNNVKKSTIMRASMDNDNEESMNDENMDSHNFKTKKSRRHKRIHKRKKRVKFKNILSGHDEVSSDEDGYHDRGETKKRHRYGNHRHDKYGNENEEEFDDDDRRSGMKSREKELGRKENKAHRSRHRDRDGRKKLENQDENDTQDDGHDDDDDDGDHDHGDDDDDGEREEQHKKSGRKHISDSRKDETNRKKHKHRNYDGDEEEEKDRGDDRGEDDEKSERKHSLDSGGRGRFSKKKQKFRNDEDGNNEGERENERSEKKHSSESRKEMIKKKEQQTSRNDNFDDNEDETENEGDEHKEKSGRKHKPDSERDTNERKKQKPRENDDDDDDGGEIDDKERIKSGRSHKIYEVHRNNERNDESEEHSEDDIMENSEEKETRNHIHNHGHVHVNHVDHYHDDNKDDDDNYDREHNRNNDDDDHHDYDSGHFKDGKTKHRRQKLYYSRHNNFDDKEDHKTDRDEYGARRKKHKISHWEESNEGFDKDNKKSENENRNEENKDQENDNEKLENEDGKEAEMDDEKDDDEKILSDERKDHKKEHGPQKHRGREEVLNNDSETAADRKHDEELTDDEDMEHEKNNDREAINNARKYHDNEHSSKKHPVMEEGHFNSKTVVGKKHAESKNRPELRDEEGMHDGGSKKDGSMNKEYKHGQFKDHRDKNTDHSSHEDGRKQHHSFDEERHLNDEEDMLKPHYGEREDRNEKREWERKEGYNSEGDGKGNGNHEKNGEDSRETGKHYQNLHKPRKNDKKLTDDHDNDNHGNHDENKYNHHHGEDEVEHDEEIKDNHEHVDTIMDKHLHQSDERKSRISGKEIHQLKTEKNDQNDGKEHKRYKWPPKDKHDQSRHGSKSKYNNDDDDSESISKHSDDDNIHDNVDTKVENRMGLKKSNTTVNYSKGSRRGGKETLGTTPRRNNLWKDDLGSKIRPEHDKDSGKGASKADLDYNENSENLGKINITSPKKYDGEKMSKDGLAARNQEERKQKKNNDDKEHADEKTTGFQHHKKALYHSLKELQSNGNDTNSNKTSHESEDSGNDGSEKYKKPRNDETSRETSKYFNQKTHGWEESRQNDGDEDGGGGKYFNQATRVWSGKKGRTDENYFPKMTTHWHLKNDTRKRGPGNYFNQRTKNWLNETMGHNQTNSKPSHHILKTSSQTTNNVSDNLMDFNKIHATNVIGIKDVKHVEKHKSKNVYPTHNKSNNSSNHIQSENIEKHQHQAKAKKVLSKHQIYEPTINNTIVGTDNRVHKIEPPHQRGKNISSEVGNRKSGKKELVVRVKQKTSDRKSAEEKVRNEILKLIGKNPGSKEGVKKINRKAVQTSHRRVSPGLTNQSGSRGVKINTKLGNASTGKRLPKIVSGERIQKPKSLHSAKSLKNKDKMLHKKVPPKSITGVKHNALPTRKNSKKRPRLSQKQRKPKILTFNTLKSNKPNGKHSAKHQPLKSPIVGVSVHKSKLGNQESVKTLPKSTSKAWSPKATATKGLQYGPTPSTIENWNKPNKIYEQGWNYDGYPGERGEGKEKEIPLTIPGPALDDTVWNSRNNHHGNTGTIVNGGNKGTTIKPTPVIFNGQLPLTSNGGKVVNGDNYGQPGIGGLSGDTSSAGNVDTSTLRRNYVTKTWSNNSPTGGQDSNQPKVPEQNNNDQHYYNQPSPEPKPVNGENSYQPNQKLKPDGRNKFQPNLDPKSVRNNGQDGGKQPNQHLTTPTKQPKPVLNGQNIYQPNQITKAVPNSGQNGSKQPNQNPIPTISNIDQIGYQPKPVLNGQNILHQPNQNPKSPLKNANDQNPIPNIDKNGHQPTKNAKPALGNGENENLRNHKSTPIQPLGTANLHKQTPRDNRPQIPWQTKPKPQQQINVNRTYVPILPKIHKLKPLLNIPRIVTSSLPPRLNSTKPTNHVLTHHTTSTFNKTLNSKPRNVTTANRPTNVPKIANPFKIEKLVPLSSHGIRNISVIPSKAKKLSALPKGCFPGEIMSEMTLENGLDSGNYTSVGRTTLMDSCISKCCEIKGCDVAIQMDNICFAMQCHSEDSCKIKTTLGKSSHHNLCFISRSKKERQSINDFDDALLSTQDICPDDKALGLTWKKTISGSFDEIPCPKKAKGLATRKCSVESQWLTPDFSDCVTSDYEELHKRAKRLVYGQNMDALLQSLAVVTTRTIENSLIFGGDLKKTTEIMTSIVQEQGVSQTVIDDRNLQNFLKTCSNLLDDSNKQEWKNIQKETSGSVDILRDSQKFITLASATRQHNETHVTNNILVQIDNQAKGRTVDKTYPDYSNSQAAVWDGEKDNIKLPSTVFNLSDTRIVTFSYKTLAALLPTDTNVHLRHSEPNSKILGIILEPRIQDKIIPAVTITLHHLKGGRVNPRCVSWDFNLNAAQGGAWSDKGCWLDHSGKKYSVCRCDHVSNYALLMDDVDHSAMQVTSKDQLHTKEMAALWICIPVLVVFILGALYTSFTWSRNPRFVRSTSLNEKSSLLGSSVTTQEIRYDYSTSPSRFVGSFPNNKDLEWQHEFEHERKKDSLTFREVHEYNMNKTSHDIDSGIESNEYDESGETPSELSIEHDTLTPEDEPEKHFSTTKEHDITEFYEVEENDPVRLEAERRVFSSNLRRSTGIHDLSLDK